MKRKILLSLLILCNLVKANVSSVEEAPKDALEDAVEHLDVKSVKDILSKEQISANRKAILAKYCQNITKLYRKRTTSIFNSKIDRFSIYAGIAGWITAALLPGFISGKHIYKRSMSTDPESMDPNEKTAIILWTPIAFCLGYFSTVSIIKGINLNNAFGNLKKARQIEYLINDINL